MKPESIVLAIAGTFFGLIVGWVIGTQQPGPARSATTPPAATQPAPEGQAAAPAPVDEGRAATLRATAEQDPSNVVVRIELANMYFDAERPADAVPWYEAALKIAPKNVNVSTDLGVCYYYLGDADRALKQFDYSLAIEPNHAKTMLNVGVVRAFGKQDLKGAAAIWESLLKISPDTAEGQAARRALDSLKSAHPELGASAQPGDGSGSR